MRRETFREVKLKLKLKGEDRSGNSRADRSQFLEMAGYVPHVLLSFRAGRRTEIEFRVVLKHG